MRDLHVTALLAATSSLGVQADFIIANTTACYGAFPMNQCKTGVQVITQGADFNTSFSCDKLWHAQDYSHVKKNSASPMSANFTSTGNVCDGESLFFSQNHTVPSVNGTFDVYKGKDDSGDRIGQCEYMEARMFESKRRCSQWLGTIFYIAAYRCNTTACGGDSSTTSLPSSTTFSSSTIALASTVSSSSSSLASSSEPTSVTTSSTPASTSGFSTRTRS
ncbi:hypothetical protein BST61_g1389 [Cercospora zeina]